MRLALDDDICLIVNCDMVLWRYHRIGIPFPKVLYECQRCQLTFSHDRKLESAFLFVLLFLDVVMRGEFDGEAIAGSVQRT